jgi:tRNA1(Val) A37 N6-methylase TrmN6
MVAEDPARASAAEDDHTTRDAVLGGRLTLRQPRRGHRVGHDALLLAAATAARPGDRVVEFGAGVGAAGLALALRAGPLRLALLEIDPALAALARDNARANGQAAEVLAFDVAAPAADWPAALAPDSADVVLMNPPYNDPQRHRGSPDGARRLAHMAETGTLDQWLRAARRLLRPGGALTLVWRADGLPDLLAALATGFGSLRLVAVHPRPEAAAIRLLVRAVKGGRAPLQLLPPLVLADADGTPGAEAERLLREAAPLAAMQD